MKNYYLFPNRGKYTILETFGMHIIMKVFCRWSFCWPGGNILTKFILETPSVVVNKSVLDIGCGCGSSSIAAIMSGAKSVVANDIDNLAGTALRLNIALNHIDSSKIKFLSDNIVYQSFDYFKQFDVIICGDMLYDMSFSARLLSTLRNHPHVYFGDVGRTYCPKHITEKYVMSKMDYNMDGFPYMYVFHLHPELIQPS